MSVARPFFSLLPLMAGVFLSSCASEAFVESRALQHKSGNVVVCRTGDQLDAGHRLAESVCLENRLSPPKLVHTDTFACAMSAPIRDVYRCGGAALGDVDFYTASQPVAASSVTKQVLSVNLDQYEDERSLFFRRED